MKYGYSDVPNSIVRAYSYGCLIIHDMDKHLLPQIPEGHYAIVYREDGISTDEPQFTFLVTWEQDGLLLQQTLKREVYYEDNKAPR